MDEEGETVYLEDSSFTQEQLKELEEGEAVFIPED